MRGTRSSGVKGTPAIRADAAEVIMVLVHPLIIEVGWLAAIVDIAGVEDRNVTE
jgi:hypothetical protein